MLGVQGSCLILAELCSLCTSGLAWLFYFQAGKGCSAALAHHCNNPQEHCWVKPISTSSSEQGRREFSFVSIPQSGPKLQPAPCAFCQHSSPIPAMQGKEDPVKALLAACMAGWCCVRALGARTGPKALCPALLQVLPSLTFGALQSTARDKSTGKSSPSLTWGSQHPVDSLPFLLQQGWRARLQVRAIPKKIQHL